VLPPKFTWIIVSPAHSIGLALYLAVGISISLLAGQSERGRRLAQETAQLLAQAEARSRTDAERLRATLEILPSAVLIADGEGQLLAANQAARTIWGGAIPLGGDFTKFPAGRLWWAQSGQPVASEESPLARVLSTGQIALNEELELEVLDGQRKVILNSVAPICDETGAVSGAVISAQDISDLRRLERDMAERAQELEAVFESMADGVFVFDAQGYATRLNAAARAILGPEAAQLGHPVDVRAIHRPLFDEDGQQLPVEQLPSVRILHGEMLTGARAVDVYAPTAEGRRQVLSVGGTPLRAADGTIFGAVVVTRDVTERRRLEREVAERVQELDAIFETITDGITVLDAEGRLIRTNRAFRSMSGIDRHPEFMTLSADQRLAALAMRDMRSQPLAREAWPATRMLQGETLTGVDVVMNTLEGRELVVNIGGAPIRDQKSHITGCVGVFRDVTAPRQLERRTRDTLAALVAMAEATVQIRPMSASVDNSDAFSTLPRSGANLTQVARRLAELTQSVLGCRRVSIVAVDTATKQLSPVTEVGLSPEQEQAWWNSWSPPQRLEERYGPVIAAIESAGEAALLDRQRLPERFWPILFGAQSGRLVPMCLGEELAGVLMVDYQESGHDYSREDEVLLTEALARLGALVLELDRSLRGWAEARANELAISETKSQMDTFLSIASHELKTPLTSLKLSIQLSERRLSKLIRGERTVADGGGDARLHRVVELLGRTTYQVGRMEALVNDLVDVSRIQAGKLEQRLELVDLAAIVREVVEAQRQSAPERSIRLHCPSDLSAPVNADAGRIEQVMTNYLTNALKYSPADRPVEVGIEVGPKQARVWVRDQGPGLPLEEQTLIWECFHQAKGVQVQSGSGIGLGLGLYISRMIVERHQGQVGVESAPDQGSTFWFTLPLTQPKAENQ
jgi:PAS domain S-box-containing protein